MLKFEKFNAPLDAREIIKMCARYRAADALFILLMRVSA